VTLEVASLVAELDAGDRRALARLLTVVEDGTPDDRRAVVEALAPRAGRARVVGITGPPGVGKSTLTTALTSALRAEGRRVAVLAVDPSSPTTGGALLGDRVRMQSHHDDEDVFIRSMASRGHLGGLAAAVPHALLVLDAAGFDDVVLETVGVGQSEIEVVAAADSTVLVLAPGMGDAVQAAKAGILEVPDLIVVNKADAGGAGRLEAELAGMLELGRHSASPDAWTPRVLRCVAVRGEGIAELVEALDAHAAAGAAGGSDPRGRARSRAAVLAVALAAVRAGLDGAAHLDALAERVATGELDAYGAAEDLVARWRAGGVG